MRVKSQAQSGALVRWIAAVAALVTVLLWSYWSTAADLYHEWQSDDNYSVGQLVPLAALYLLWHNRGSLKRCPVRACWWGLVLIVIAHFARMYGLKYLYESAERYALVLTIVGVVLTVGGWQIFRRTIWILAFLFLMVPFPGKVHNQIAGPLQDHATTGAVFLLELFGTSVAQEGNVIVLNGDVQLAVAEACSGLRMLTAFIVVGSVLAYVVDRPRWQKVTLVCSTIPVAIVCNLLRLVVTAQLFTTVSSELAEIFFHDFAGWTMMPLAIFILVGELWLMGKLVIPEGGEPSLTHG